jgi:hypothetical protein
MVMPVSFIFHAGYQVINSCMRLEQSFILFDFINGAGDVTAWLEPKAP